MGLWQPWAQGHIDSEDLALSLKTRKGMEDTHGLDWNEVCKSDRHSRSHSPLFNSPYPIFSKLWGIIIKQQGILQREIEIVTKLDRENSFRTDLQTWKWNVLRWSYSYKARWGKEMVNESDYARKFGIVLWTVITKLKKNLGGIIWKIGIDIYALP